CAGITGYIATIIVVVAVIERGHDQIIAIAAKHLIVTVAAIEQVIAVLAEDAIIAIAAIDHVVVVAAEQIIVAIIAEDDVSIRAGIGEVAIGARPDHIGPGIGDDIISAG